MTKLNKFLPEHMAILRSLTCEDICPDSKTAIKLAELVLPIYENEHPDDDRPRKAIAAAKTYLANPTPENLQLLTEARDAAYWTASFAASYATYSAQNATYWTADAAPYATCEATNDATNPAYWAAESLNITRYKTNLQDINKTTLKSDSWVRLI